MSSNVNANVKSKPETAHGFRKFITIAAVTVQLLVSKRFNAQNLQRSNTAAENNRLEMQERAKPSCVSKTVWIIKLITNVESFISLLVSDYTLLKDICHRLAAETPAMIMAYFIGTHEEALICWRCCSTAKAFNTISSLFHRLHINSETKSVLH